MKIRQVHLRTAALPRRDPEWRTATYAASTVPAIYVGIETDDGLVGVGATSAKARHDTNDELLDELTRVVRPSLEGADLVVARARLRAAVVRPRVRIAVDLALHDLLGKLAGLPAEAWWGGRARTSVPVIRMVGLKPPDAIVAAVEPLVASGCTQLKIKSGSGVAADVTRIRALRAAFGDRLELTVDANGAYAPTEAILLCDLLHEQGVSVVEQPVAYTDVEGLRKVTMSTAVDVLADQCVYDVATAVEICQTGAADLVSVKLTKMGSVELCSRVAAVCRAFGVRVRMGGSAAPALVDGAACRLVLADPLIEEAAEIAESEGLDEIAGGGPSIVDGRATIEASPGIGGPQELFADGRLEAH